MYSDYKEKILGFYRAHRRLPGYSEIMDLVGFRSKNAVYKLIKKLVAEGLVEKDRRGRLLPAARWRGDLPLLGLVEAGFPSAAEEELSDTISLDDYLIKRKEASYLLRVKGDSMIEAGIREGDLVIAERGATPREGDIVIAEVDGDWTMKYYRRRAGKVYLEPANKKYHPIYPTVELKIAAIVRGVVRKY